MHTGILYKLVFTGLLFALQVQAGEIQLELEVPSVQVEDGDTVILNLADSSQRLNLAGIDAPEDSDNPKLQHDLKRTSLEKERLIQLGAAATTHLKQLIKQNSSIQLVYNPDIKDRYGRLVGHLLNSEGISLSETMLVEGYAISTKDAGQKFQQLWHDARDNKRGIWQLDSDAADSWSGSANP